jgi:hypothetical protein
MPKKNIIIASLILIVVLALAYFLYTPKAPISPEQEIRSIVGAFSEKIELVSLTGTDEQVLAAIKENYGPYISEGLMTGWQMNPKSAPGKMSEASSPDHIEIIAIEPTDDGAYEVQGKVIETLTRPQNGVQKNYYQLAMKFRYQNGRWLMTGLTKQLPTQ